MKPSVHLLPACKGSWASLRKKKKSHYKIMVPDHIWAPSDAQLVERHATDFPQTLKMEPTLPHLDFGLLAYKIIRE